MVVAGPCAGISGDRESRRWKSAKVTVKLMLSFPALVRAVLLPLVLLVIVGPARSADEFPRRVQHALGMTTILKAPERIVTLGWSSEDAVLALGKIPVGMPRYRFFESGIFPWNEERLAGTRPHLLEGAVDYEAIAALRPDLIFAIYSGIDAHAYERLSRLAPTVVYRSAPWSADWKEQMELVGDALGKRDEASALIEKTASSLSAMGASQLILHGKTFTFGTYFAGASGMVVYLQEDPRVAALLELGLEASPGIVALSAANAGRGSIEVSIEKIDMLDADVLVMWYAPGARAAAEAQPLFQALGAVKRGAYVALEDPVEVWSTSALSVLSVPYGFPRFVPRLAEAATRTGRQ